MKKRKNPIKKPNQGVSDKSKNITKAPASKDANTKAKLLIRAEADHKTIHEVQPLPEVAAITPANGQNVEKKAKSKKLKKKRKTDPSAKTGVEVGNIEEPKSALDSTKENGKPKKRKKKTKDKTGDTKGLSQAEIDQKILDKIARKKAKKLRHKLKKEMKARLKELGAVEQATTEAATDQTISDQLQATSDDVAKAQVKADKKKNKKLKKDKAKKDKQDAKENTLPKDIDAATIFVGNLPVTTKRVQLVHHFSDYGPIHGIRIRTAAGNVIYKHKFRKAAGSLNAYIILKDEEAAKAALVLNGSEFKGHHIRVTLASAADSGQVEPKRTIFVGNLKYSANEEKLHEIFVNCGDIEYVRCLRQDENACKGVAYVCFKSMDAVGLALELNGTLLDDRPIHVERYSMKRVEAKTKPTGSDTAGSNSRKGKKNTKKGATAASKKPIKGVKNKRKDVKSKAKLSETEESSAGPKKKTAYRGVKVDAMKAKSKMKKKPPNAMQKLAKKIAPRPK